MTSSVIITIVVVLGIIVAGGFLLYFIGDLLMSLSNKGKDNEAVKNAQLKKQKELESRVKALENNQGKEGSTTILYNGAVVESYNPEEEENKEVDNAVEEPVNVEENTASEEVEEKTEENAEESNETEDTPSENVEETEESEETTEEEQAEEDEASEYIRQRRAELMERLARMQSAEDEEEETEENDAVDVSEEETEEPAETTEEETEEVAEPEEEKTADVVADNKFDEAKNNDEEGKNSLASTMSLEELEAKLAEEQDRLKANEKELRQCKKEFLPLRRVKKTLENDEKKLRRKEALVAKQKVVLYGVNNYADIDEEKAKKLAEDLDLLDGLKLSVQHCEEVMAKNEERYPLLEKIYNLLTSQNTEIKDDIKKLQEAIDELKSSDTDSATDSTDAE